MGGLRLSTYGPLGYIDHPVYVFFRQWLIAVMATVLIQLGLFAALAVLLRMWKTPLWAWIVLVGSPRLRARLSARRT